MLDNNNKDRFCKVRWSSGKNIWIWSLSQKNYHATFFLPENNETIYLVDCTVTNKGKWYLFSLLQVMQDPGYKKIDLGFCHWNILQIFLHAGLPTHFCTVTRICRGDCSSALNETSAFYLLVDVICFKCVGKKCLTKWIFYFTFETFSDNEWHNSGFFYIECRTSKEGLAKLARSVKSASTH